MKLYIHRNGEQYGPYKEEQVRADLFRRHNPAHDTLITSNRALQPTAGRLITSVFGMKQLSIPAKLALLTGGRASFSLDL